MGKKLNFLILLLILSVFLLNNVSSDSHEPKFTAEVDSAVSIVEECETNGFPCGSNFQCNISVQNPNENTIIVNQEMTRNSTFYNFTVGESNSVVLGEYPTSVCCTNTTSSGCSEFFYEITPSGSRGIRSGEGSTLSGILIILLFSTAFFLILGILTKNEPFKVFFVGLSILLMIGTLGFGVTVMQQLFGTFGGLLSGFGTFYRLLIILLSAGGMGLVLYLIKVGFTFFSNRRLGLT